MADQRADLLSPCDIPDLRCASQLGPFPPENALGSPYLALEIVVASKEQPARDRRGNGRDTAEDGLGLKSQLASGGIRYQSGGGGRTP